MDKTETADGGQQKSAAGLRQQDGAQNISLQSKFLCGLKGDVK